jgi:uncharacterized protein (TIGR00369 family)
MSFFVEGETLRCQWHPRTELEGYPGVIHGGIQATLADEIGGWFIHSHRGTAGVTKDLQITYHSPARADLGPFELTAKMTREAEKEITMEVTIHGSEGTLFSTATITYAKFSELVARKRLGFPGGDCFRV